MTTPVAPLHLQPLSMSIPSSFRIPSLLAFLTLSAFALALSPLLSPLTSHAHGDAHEFIASVTEEIRKNPRDGEAYFRRAELYRRHGDWDQAFADFERASRFLTNSLQLDLAKGLTLVDAKWYHTGMAYLDRVLARETNHVVALTARGRAHAELGETLAASRDLSSAIRFTAEPRPEIYIERARILSSGTNAMVAEALRGLEEGIQKLGPLVTLQLHAIDLELRLQQTNAALARIDKIVEMSPRKEPWLARKGEILVQAGRNAEARTAFEAALKAIQSLPATRRNVPAIQELEKRIRLLLGTPASSTAPSTSTPPPAPKR